ncbi:MAG: extracellular solute-binding protein [Acidobacteriota bacterium]|nr:extracellular solute-binding protein [Acidobacteriota bacterium]
MKSRQRSLTRTRLAGTLGLVLAALVLAVSAAGSATARGSGDVNVLAAGSLNTLMTKVVGPAFQKATGYKLVNYSAGSSTLAADIKNKVQVADVFVSASPAVNATLEGKKNGGWVSWYASFAASPVVLAYYPKSRFAKDLRSTPWYKVITMPGFRLGRTDPTQDPGGVLARKALEQTARTQHLPALKKLATESSDVYSEVTEQAGIQSGQLDASFMYEADANSQKSPFVKLTGVNLAGNYTITLLKGAPHTAAAEAFIKFLLGPIGRKEMRAYHFVILSPAKASGSGVPAALRGVIR